MLTRSLLELQILPIIAQWEKTNSLKRLACRKHLCTNSPGFFKQRFPEAPLLIRPKYLTRELSSIELIHRELGGRLNELTSAYLRQRALSLFTGRLQRRLRFENFSELYSICQHIVCSLLCLKVHIQWCINLNWFMRIYVKAFLYLRHWEATKTTLVL